MAAVTGLLAVGIGQVLVLPVALGLAGPAGLDPDLWLLSAWNAEVGAPAAVPPLWPALLAAWPGPPDIDAAAALAAALATLLPVATWALARNLGAHRVPALIAGLSVLAVPVLAGQAVSIQPDGLVALLLLASVAAARAALDRPSAPRLALLLLLAALAPLARVHGVVVSGLLVLVAAGAPGQAADRVVRAMAATVAAIVGPLLLGAPAGLPWDQAWFSRVSGSSADTLATAEALPEELPAALRATIEAGGPRAWAAIAASDLSRAAELWGLLLLAVAALLLAHGLPARRRLAPLVGLLPAVPTLLAWTHPRHVAVCVPVALAVLAAAPDARTARRWWALAAAFLAAGLLRAPALATELRQQAVDIDELRAFGEALCARAAPGDLLAGEPRVRIGCPMPQHSVGEQRNPGDWRTWLVTAGAAPPGWKPEPLTLGDWRVYRLPSPSSTRPCAASAPAPDTPYLAVRPTPAVLVPPCSEGGAPAASRPDAHRSTVPDHKPGGDRRRPR